jgi:hypothetical protein
VNLKLARRHYERFEALFYLHQLLTSPLNPLPPAGKLHINPSFSIFQEELYFVEGGASGPFSPRNELEALYHLHQLLTRSSDPLPQTTNQPVDPEPINQPFNPKSISQPMNHKTSNQPLHQKTIDQLTNPETINQALDPKTIDQPTTAETSNQPIDAQTPSYESEDVRKAAIAEVEQRLIAYGADEEPAEKAEGCSGVAEQELERWAAENGVVSKVEAAG